MFTIKNEELSSAHMFRADEFISDSPVLPGASTMPTTSAGHSVASQANSDAQLFSTLCEIDKNNYLYLFERCKAYNINARQLRFLEKEHIRRIIPADQIGIMAEFEHQHSVWRMQFQLQPPQTQPRVQLQLHAQPDLPTAQPPQTVNVTPLPTNLGRTSTTAKSVESDIEQHYSSSPVTDYVINMAREEDEEEATAMVAVDKKLKRRFEDRKHYRNRNSKGSVGENEYLLDDIIKHDMRRFREEYKINGILTERDRRRLAAALVEYFKSNDIYMSREIMESLAVQISTAFPTESKLAWHDSEGRQRRGRLTLRLYNMQRSKRMQKKYFPERYREVEDEETQDPLNTNDVDMMDEAKQEEMNEYDKEAERLQDWLRNNKCEDNDELTQMWYETTNYRTRQLKKYANTQDGQHLEDVFEKWPAYKTTMGNILINIDFNAMYPHSESVFYERWPIFLEKIHKLYKLELRLDMYDRYYKNESSLSEETKHSVLVQLIHAIVRPTRSVIPKMVRRYTIAESQNAFCTIISHPKEMDSYAAAQPMIFIVGVSTFNVQKVFVAFKDVRYEMKFLDAFYTSFQIYLIFKMDFPLACTNFWILVQTYFFDIKPKPETNLAAIDHIIKFLLA